MASSPTTSYPIRELASWWNNLDLGAPPTELEVFGVDQLDTADSSDWQSSSLAVVTAERKRDLELESTSTALVSASLGVNLMELTPARYDLDGTIDYEAWMTACLEVREQLRELQTAARGATASKPDAPELPLPEPFDVIEKLIVERSRAGLATLINGQTAAAALLTAHAQDPSVVDHVRFLAYSPSPIAMRVSEYVKVPAVVPMQVSYADATIRNLALETISAAVNNAENSRLALLADLNPQTEA